MVNFNLFSASASVPETAIIPPQQRRQLETNFRNYFISKGPMTEDRDRASEAISRIFERWRENHRGMRERKLSEA